MFDFHNVNFKRVNSRSEIKVKTYHIGGGIAYAQCLGVYAKVVGCPEGLGIVDLEADGQQVDAEPTGPAFGQRVAQDEVAELEERGIMHGIVGI